MRHLVTHTTAQLLSVALVLALAVPPVGAMQPAPATTFTSMQQGMHELRALNGRLLMVAGSYHDTTSYKRSMTFYFEVRPGGEWLHVPVIESEVDHELTLFSVGKGEETVEDAVLTTQGNDHYLIVAEKKAGIVVARWYKFAAAGADYPDGPAYMFKPVGANTYAKSANSTVATVLQKEVRLRAKQ